MAFMATDHHCSRTFFIQLVSLVTAMASFGSPALLFGVALALVGV